jgi:hypothetical protein
MLIEVSPRHLERRFGLGADHVMELWLLLAAERGAQVPRFFVGRSLRAEKISAASARLLDKGLLCWSTRKGWIFGREPRNPATNRRVSGFTFLSREGVRAVMPYAEDLLRDRMGSDPVAEARIRRTMEGAYLAALGAWPEAPTGFSGSLLGEAGPVPPSVPAVAAGTGPPPLSRLARLTWDGAWSGETCGVWAVAIRSGRMVVAAEGAPGGLQPHTIFGIDPQAGMGLAWDGTWCSLGRYDERAVVESIRADAERRGSSAAPRDFTERGQHGRFLRREEALLALAGPEDEFPLAMREARRLRDLAQGGDNTPR